jgi:hypothetical protein
MDTAPKPFVFVLMPFSKDFNDIYKLGIKPACKNAGAYAQRVDEQIFQESILERVYNQISKADIIIADLTGRNPNVFYEVGYAHALGKLVILLTQNANDIPFDLKHYPHIIYGGEIADKLLPDLQKRVMWALEQTRNPEMNIGHDLLYYIDKNKLTKEETIEIYPEGGYSFPLTFVINIDIHNPVVKVIKDVKAEYVLVTKDPIQFASPITTIESPDGGYIHLLRDKPYIRAGMWYRLSFPIKIYRRDPSEDKAKLIECILREYTGMRIRDIPFGVSLKLSKDEN